MAALISLFAIHIFVHTCWADYHCLCSFGVTVPIYGRPDNTTTPIGNLYDYDCRASYNLSAESGFETVGYNNMFGYVERMADLSVTQCQGNIPELEKVTIKATTTTRITPTSTPLPARPLVTTPRTTTATIKFPDGHTELCPDIAKSDVQRHQGLLGQHGVYCYEYVPYITQWKNAERHCNMVAQGHLTSVMSQDEQDFILRFLKSHNHTDPIWIGLTDSEHEGSWEWITGEPLNYNQFLRRYSWHTDDTHKLYDCAVLQSNGEWIDLPCGTQLVLGTGFGEAHSYICKYMTTKVTSTTTTTPSTTQSPANPSVMTPMTSTTTMKIPEGHTDLCPDIAKSDGFLGQYGVYCYEYVPYQTQWKNAERHCNIVAQGHLTSVMNQDEQDYILRFLKSHSHTDPIWIGLTDSDSEGRWEWITGQPLVYNQFLKTFALHTEYTHKLNDCAVLQSNGEWVDLPCGVQLVLGTGFGEAHSYVCKYNVTSTPPDVFHGGMSSYIVG